MSKTKKLTLFTKKLFFILTLLLLSTLEISKAFDQIKYSWTAKELVELYPNQNLVDTNNYLNKINEDYQFIEEAIEVIFKEMNISTYVFILNNMDIYYKKYYVGSKDIELFANELAFNIFNGDLEKDRNSLIIVFSMEDRQNRIRTGRNTKELLTDKFALKYLENIKKQLKAGEYTEAIADLMNSILSNLNGDNYWEILFEYGKILFFVSICLALIVSVIYSCFRDRPMKSRLDKIKEITKKNISKDAFIDLNCTICLEEFTKEELEELKEKQNPINSYSKNEKTNCCENLKSNSNYSSSRIKLNEENDLIDIDDIIIEHNEKEGIRERNNNISTENQTDNLNEKSCEKIKEKSGEKKDESFIAKLNCGHIFHSECIANWMAKKNSCPLCKKSLDDSGENTGNKDSNSTRTNNESNISFAEELVNIQTVFYPRISQYRLDYSNSSFAYHDINNSSNSSFGNFVSGSLSGGASSSW